MTTGQPPEGFVLRHDFLSDEEEAALLQLVRRISYGEVRMYGVVARRRVAQFGWHYSFDSFRLTAAPDLPAELCPVRERAALFAGIEPEAFAETLVTEYPPGASIGWHRDAPPFGIIAGVSLGAACRMRFQRGSGPDRVSAAVVLPPRSIYLLMGSARKDWQHTIPAVRELRYSITFRTLKRPRERLEAPNECLQSGQ
jgi:alkylated DNA repair dioxygenase AlkB